jgi:hypothetical protein
MKFRIPASLFIGIIILGSCSSSSTKEKINKAGDITGQVVGQFSKGVANGVTKAFDVSIELPKTLMDNGIKLGKMTVSSDTVGTDNLLVAYIIFDKDFNQTLTAKAFDSKGQEMGRVSVAVNEKKNEAKFVEFHFDKRTNIDSDSKLTFE